MRVLNLFGEENAKLSAIARRYFWTASVVSVLALATGLLEGVGVGLLIPLLSTFTNDLGTNAGGALGLLQRFAGGHSRNERLLIVCGVILACMLLKSALQVVANRFGGWVDGTVAHEILCGLAARLQNVGYPFFLVEDPARLLNIISSEAWKASEAVRIVLARVAEASGVLVFAVMLLIVSWKLSLMVVIGGLVARSIQRAAETRLRALSAKTVKANQDLADRMLFVVFAARLVRLFHTQEQEQALFEGASDRLRRTNLEVEKLSGTLGPLLEALHGLLFIIVLVVAVFSHISLPVLAAFLVLMNRLQPHLRAFEQAGAGFASSAAHFKEVEWLLQESGKPVTPTGHLPFTGLKDAIEFEDVTFEYHDRGDPALNKVSFKLQRGRATALIGSSGAGKSTLVSVLCRLVEPASGVVKVDGRPLSEIKLSDWLAAIAIAGQDIDLIDATIAENIAYGQRNVSEDRIRQAAFDAGATFLEELPHGLQTLVGSHGLSLSGGQRQRIGIARALIREPEILIFDEATNAVDSETEDGIIERLKNLPSKTTLLVISHRKSTLAFCDDAVVIDHGRVVKTGPLSTLQEYQGQHFGGVDHTLKEQAQLPEPATPVG